ncbi:MAG: cell division protein ZapA [Spirochaetales bacterium]
MKRSMRIDLLGTSFTIQSDENPAYLRNLVGYYRDKLAEVRQSVNTSDDLKIAILGALTVVDELFKERHRNENSDPSQSDRFPPSGQLNTAGEHQNPASRDLSELADRLIKQLDAALEDNDDGESSQS